MAYVITHPEIGIYLGSCLGMGFWSKLDPVGQPCAITFQTEKQAEDHMSMWDDGKPEGIRLHLVIPDSGEYASIAACVAAGLEGWIDEVTPVANSLPN